MKRGIILYSTYRRISLIRKWIFGRSQSPVRQWFIPYKLLLTKSSFLSECGKLVLVLTEPFNPVTVHSSKSGLKYAPFNIKKFDIALHTDGTIKALHFACVMQPDDIEQVTFSTLSPTVLVDSTIEVFNNIEIIPFNQVHFLDLLQVANLCVSSYFWLPSRTRQITYGKLTIQAGRSEIVYTATKVECVSSRVNFKTLIVKFRKTTDVPMYTFLKVQ